MVAVAALCLTEWRLWQGVDLADESFYVAVPYRFSVGARPFVDEFTFSQVPTLLTYPLVKPFVALQGGHSDAIMVYMRHLYLIFATGVAAAVLFASRRLVRGQFALLIASVYLSFVLFELPQLSYNTMGAGFLTLGVAFGLLGLFPRAVRSGASAPAAPSATVCSVWPPWFVAAGVAHGLAGFAFPTLWSMVLPYAAVLGACIVLRQPLAGSTRWGWWPAALGYAAGAALVAATEAGVLLSFGWNNVQHSLDLQLAGAKDIGQVGGWSKLGQVVEGLGRLIWSRPYFLLAAFVLYALYRRWPRLGRGLLVLLPLPLFLAGERDLLKAAGFALILAFLAPYLYLFVPAHLRRPAGVLLLWAALPAIASGLLSGWTSAEGFPHAALGVMPAIMASCVFLCWALLGVRESGRDLAPGQVGPVRGDGNEPGVHATEPTGQTLRDLGEWMARQGTALTAVALVALVACCCVYQFQYLPRFVPYRSLDAWVASGPYWGIHTTAQRKEYLEQFARDLKQNSTPRDRLLVYSQFPGAYLFWPYRTATAGVWFGETHGSRRLPPILRKWMRQHDVVPSLVVRTRGIDGLSDVEYQRLYGAELGYDMVLRRPQYTFLRRPPGYTPPFMRRP